VLGVSALLFVLISFAKSALSVISAETVYIWRTEQRKGLAKIENLFRRSDQSQSAFSILKIISLTVVVLASNLIFISPPFNDETKSLLEIGMISLISLSFLGLIETASRMLIQNNGPYISTKIYIPISLIGLVLSPITRSQEKILEMMGSSSQNDESGSTASSTNSLAMHLDDQGDPLEEHEVRMIRGVFKLDKTVAREIMVPRVDVTAMDILTSLDSLVDIMLSSGHSKIPIYREDLDRIEGIAHSMDILRFLSDANGTRSINLEQCLRPVLFIPESKTLEDLLTEFQEKRMQMAIVIDEYGGVSGLVTVEDLVEEIVGELHDEFDRGEAGIRKINDTEYYMDAGIDIDDITQTIGVPFEGEGFDTIGGFVLHQLGKIPSPGDEFSYNGLKIQVISTLGRRLKSLKITTPKTT
jgi:putative hemolysin